MGRGEAGVWVREGGGGEEATSNVEEEGFRSCIRSFCEGLEFRRTRILRVQAKLYQSSRYKLCYSRTLIALQQEHVFSFFLRYPEPGTLKQTHEQYLVLCLGVQNVWNSVQEHYEYCNDGKTLFQTYKRPPSTAQQALHYTPRSTPPRPRPRPYARSFVRYPGW